MFGKPTKLAKPRNTDEAARVQQGLREKYPDMVTKTGPWGKARKTRRTQQVSAALADAGVTVKEMPTDQERRGR